MKGYLTGTSGTIIHPIKLEELIEVNDSDEEYNNEVNIKRSKGIYFNDEFQKKIDDLPPENRQTATRLAIYQDLWDDTFTDGYLMHYPQTGLILRQPDRSFFYRGENETFQQTHTSLSRHLLHYSEHEREYEKIIAELRIKEFESFIKNFSYVHEFSKLGITVLYEQLAQHYGLKTNWLDITSDLDIALFFSSCKFSEKENRWVPLSGRDLKHNKYANLFQTQTFYKCEDSFNGNISLTVPTGYQPFFRCQSQSAYAIKIPLYKHLEESSPVFHNRRFIFKRDENFCRQIYEKMHCGNLIYPDEGLRIFQDQINLIKEESQFSTESLEIIADNYEYNKEILKNRLIRYNKAFEFTTNHIYHIDQSQLEQVNKYYEQHSIFNKLNITYRPIMSPH